MISVIVPVFKAGKTLRRCVDSLLTQTRIIDEIILVDDGSTDDSAYICDYYCLLHSTIKVIHQENHGVSFARNIGIKAASGNYIGFVDSDDWVEMSMYEMLCDSMEFSNSDLAACAIINETQNGTFPEVDTGKVTLLCGEKIYSAVLSTDTVRGYLWNKVFKRELIYQLLDETISQCEDLLFVVNYLKNTSCAVFIQLPLYHYTRSALNISELSERSLSLVDAYEAILPIIEVNVPSCKAEVELNLLKIYLNFRARCLLIDHIDQRVTQRIKEGCRSHFQNVLFSRHTSCIAKLNVLLTYAFPRSALKAKNAILQKRQENGKWES